MPVPPALARLRPSEEQMYALVALQSVRTDYDIQPDVPSDLLSLSRSGVNAYILDHFQDSVVPPGAQEASIDARVTELRQTWIDFERTGRLAVGEVLALRPAPIGRWVLKGTELGGVFGIHLKERLRVDITFADASSGGISNERHAQGPPWRQNSCAVDTAFYLMLCSNAGILQYDQLPFRCLEAPDQHLNPFHLISRFRWEDFNDKDRDKLLVDWRDRCRRDFTDPEGVQSEDFHPISEMYFESVLRYALEGIPQFTWRQAEIRVCDTCGDVSDHEDKAERCVVLELNDGMDRWLHPDEGRGTLEGRVQAAFGFRSPARHATQCTMPDCLGRVHKAMGVGCSLPPRIVVVPSQSLNCYGKGACSFGDISPRILVVGPDGRCFDETVHYRLRAIVNYQQGHFTACWRRTRQNYDLYDGIKNRGNVTSVSLEDFLKQKRDSLRGWRRAHPNGVVSYDDPEEPTVVALLFERKDCFEL